MHDLFFADDFTGAMDSGLALQKFLDIPRS